MSVIYDYQFEARAAETAPRISLVFSENSTRRLGKTF